MNQHTALDQERITAGKLREKGYTFRQIAAAMNLPNVTMARNRVIQYFKLGLGESHEAPPDLVPMNIAERIEKKLADKAKELVTKRIDAALKPLLVLTEKSKIRDMIPRLRDELTEELFPAALIEVEEQFLKGIDVPDPDRSAELIEELFNKLPRPSPADRQPLDPWPHHPYRRRPYDGPRSPFGPYYCDMRGE